VASLIAPPDARPVPAKRHTVALVALGCPKNTVDAEVMLGDLQRYGMRIVAKPEEADIVCTVADRTKST
jgi:tRNA A37 methylthiotransferase MiaB